MTKSQFKNIILLLFICLQTSFSQVGIGTTNPLDKLHVAGNTSTIRIDGLSSTNNPNNNALNPSSVYVDENGALTLAGPLTDSSMPEDNSSTFVPIQVNIDTNSSGNFTQSTLYSTSITLTQNSLIEIVYQIGVNIVKRTTGGPIDDGNPRQYGTALIIEGNILGYSSECYTSSGNGTILSGTFFLNGNGYTQLSPGTYGIDLIGFVSGGSKSCRGEFGGNTGLDRFQIIIHN